MRVWRAKAIVPQKAGKDLSVLILQHNCLAISPLAQTSMKIMRHLTRPGEAGQVAQRIKPRKDFAPGLSVLSPKILANHAVIGQEGERNVR